MSIRLDRIALLIALLMTVGCVECWFEGQPDCIGNHTIIVEDSQGTAVSEFDALLSVPSTGIMIEISCRTEVYNSSEYHVCTSRGLNIRHFDEPVDIEIASIDGTQQASGTLELSITPASNECTCASFQTYMMRLTP